MKKLQNLARRNAQRLGALAATAAATGSANAALPTSVTTAITDAGVDLATGATAVIVTMVAFWGLKKLGGKMGWW